MTEKPKGKKRGAPPPSGLEERKHSGVLCTAMRRDRTPCTNFAMNGTNVCRMHGGAAPQVRAAAQVRILMASDTAIARLVKLLGSKDERVVLAAARDLADRANLAGKQSIEVGVVQPRSFEDWVGDALTDVEEDEWEDARELDIVDADVVEDPPAMNRHDRALAAEVEREKRRAPEGLARSTEAEAALGGYRDEAEAQMFADLEKRKRASNANKRREAFMKAIDAGATHDQAHAAGERAVNGEELPPRRRRQFVRGEFAKRPSSRD